MSMPPDERSEFERRTQAVLDTSVERLDGRTRSRLNQARQRALEEYAARQGAGWRRWFAPGALLPAGAVAAAALVAVTLWIGPRSVDGDLPVARGEVASPLEDLELLADGTTFTEDGDVAEYDFYEWAAAEVEAEGEAVGT